MQITETGALLQIEIRLFFRHFFSTYQKTDSYFFNNNCGLNTFYQKGTFTKVEYFIDFQSKLSPNYFDVILKNLNLQT